ncbi:type II toxin-antitoxin system RelE family toxin [Methanoculleus sp.]|uniref:type II toxin-antitoxin system RelE family toxin n=1 Tax=Methanoculleus sp. TaxID=90427 RepID=UPI002FC9A7EC
MVTVAYGASFERTIKKIRDSSVKDRVKKQIIRIVRDPLIGKPMRYGRKQTREVYIPPFRLSYCYDESRDLLIFLELYHKDEQ